MDIKTGIIRWDSYVSSDKYVGGFSTRALSPSKYHHRVPFFADITDDGNVNFPTYTQEVFEREIKYAAAAGIDYFAYCWYPSEKAKTDTLPETDGSASNISELSQVRRMHKNSSLKDKVKMCAIVNTSLLEDEDYDELASEMSQDYYQKYNGKPLVYVFNGADTETSALAIASVTHAAKKHNLAIPYFVMMLFSNEKADTAIVDAISCYADGTPVPDATFDGHSDIIIKANLKRREYGLPVIPTMSLGWNPYPRIDNPVPWTSYEAKIYSPEPDCDSMVRQAAHIRELLDGKNKLPNIGHVLIFAWNEFEEGGWACPTIQTDKNGNAVYDNEGNRMINTLHLEALKGAIDVLKA